MFARLVALAAPLLVLSASALGTPSPRSGPTSGVIIKPVDGTAIAPNQTFDFQYGTSADYGRSSYNFTVWLLTGPAASNGLPIMGTDMTGHYFGRWSYDNYPGNPYPRNPAPAQLTMPDFSKNYPGFGAGASTHDATFYFAVVEEWASGEGAVGHRLHTAMNRIVYNATVSA